MFQKYWIYDEALGKLPQQGFSLNDEPIAQILRDTIHFYNGKMYVLHSYCLMSNHVHLLLCALQRDNGSYYTVDQIVQSLKKYSAKKINEILGREGQFWDQYYFDRIIRDEDNYRRVMDYVLNNPVKAGLVDRAEIWKDSYCNMEVYNV